MNDTGRTAQAEADRTGRAVLTDDTNLAAHVTRALLDGAADPDTDRTTRWQPTPEQWRWARALFAADLDLERVFVAAVHPGKIGGMWFLHTTVEPVPGLWPVPSARSTPTAYRIAREQACEAARRQLGNRKGTTSYMVIGRDGHAPAFEC